MKTRNNLTKEQKEFLIELCKKYKSSEICKMFYEKYGIKKSQGTINYFRHYHNIKCECYPIIKTDEQKEFIKNILVYHNNEESANIFFKKYGYKISERNLINIRTKYKIKKKYKQYDKCNNTMLNKKPLYSEYVNPNGDTYIRIGKKRQVKTRFIWEKYHNKKIPKGYNVIFLDGNKNNYDINNLVLVKKGTLIYSIKKEIELCDKDIIKTVDMVRLLDKKIKNKEI